MSIMKNKIVSLTVVYVLLSFSVFSQTNEKSATPKLDKFRQLKQNSRDAMAAADTAAAPALTTVSTNNIKPATSVGTPSISAAPVNVQSKKPTLSANISVPPPVDTAAIVENDNSASANTTTPQPPTQPREPVQAQPEKKTIYRDTRLGSSSRLYDTYEKNNNGAGSVTTSPK